MFMFTLSLKSLNRRSYSTTTANTPEWGFNFLQIFISFFFVHYKVSTRISQEDLKKRKEKKEDCEEIKDFLLFATCFFLMKIEWMKRKENLLKRQSIWWWKCFRITLPSLFDSSQSQANPTNQQSNRLETWHFAVT